LKCKKIINRDIKINIMDKTIRTKYKWNSLNIATSKAKEVEANIVNIRNQKVNLNILNILKALNSHNFHKNKCKLEDGNGLIQSFKVLVHVLEEDIQRHYLALLLLFLEDIISPAKQKDMLILMTLIFLMLMQINLQNLKYLVHLQLHDMLIPQY
jgi:hypothetical protein